MFDDRRSTGPILATLVILSGLTQLAPIASAENCTNIDGNWDIHPGEGWVRSSQPASDEIQASRLMRLFLFPEGGPDEAQIFGFNAVDATNGIDGFVHDLGCATTTDRDWCLHAINDDQTGSLLPTDDSQRLVQHNTPDNWRLAFYAENPIAEGRLGPIAEHSSTIRDVNNLCNPGSTTHAEDSRLMPPGTRYVVIWLDSSELTDEGTDLDTVENLVPRGYQTREHLWGTYNAHFYFNTCADGVPGANNPCD